MFAFSFVLSLMLFSSRARAQLHQYDTKYYTIYTDIDPDQEKEAAIRMTKMAEEYHARTKGFSGEIHSKFPFYLYKSSAEYYAAGGLPGSAGVFMSIGSGGKLMAIAGQNSARQTWHTVQHEGFHQFAHAVIGGDIPTWLNEGLAEYFGESIFTGDGFVTGLISPWRMERLQDEINGGDTLSIPQIMKISPEQWASQLNIKEYDQAWSMVHFLVHADDQKYQVPFSNCIREISKGRPFDRAWVDTLGSTDGFEQRWKDWWLTQPKNPTAMLYGKAAASTMTSFVARAFVEKQTFADFEAFHAAVDDDKLKISDDDWLPHTLIVSNFRLYGDAPHWELQNPPGKQPMVELTLTDGTRLTGSFVLRGSHVESVNVDIDDMAPALKDAQALLDAGKKDQARAMVQAKLHDIPKSALAADARKFLQTCR
jgi:Protein of unknown function (DUF1570)